METRDTWNYSGSRKVTKARKNDVVQSKEGGRGNIRKHVTKGGGIKEQWGGERTKRSESSSLTTKKRGEAGPPYVQ